MNAENPRRDRVPAGVPSGGQFAPQARAEGPVALEVEFAADEAEQVDLALQAYGDDIVSKALNSPSLVWSDPKRAAWAATNSARQTLAGLRIHLADAEFARNVFTGEEARQMEKALAFYRSRTNRAEPSTQRAIAAAQFRIEIAEPLVREHEASTFDTPDTTGSRDTGDTGERREQQ